MSWNYRVFRKTCAGHAFYEIHEVYYRLDGTIKGWTENPINPSGETPEELKQDIFMHLEALQKPIIDHQDLVGIDCEKG